MRIRKIRFTAAFVLTAVLAVLLFTGCPAHSISPYGLKVTGDGTGAAIAVYEETLGGNIYVQKISPDGQTQWGDKGILLGVSNSRAYTYPNTHIISVSDGVIIGWYSYGEKDLSPVFHVTKLDSAGTVLWQQNVFELGGMLGDGTGGVILGSKLSDSYEYLCISSIDAAGNVRDPVGERVAPAVKYEGRLHEWQMVTDGAGGAIVVWYESRYPGGARPGERSAVDYLCAQRIDSEGTLLWGDEWGNGMDISLSPEISWIEALQVTADGAGGAVLAWFQVTEVFADDGDKSQVWDFAVQKIDADGNVLWPSGGVNLGITAAGGQPTPNSASLIVADGTGGAIIGWRDFRDGTAYSKDIYAQRVDTDGNLLWTAGGRPVAVTSLNPRAQAVSDGTGGAIFAYSCVADYQTLHVQRLDGDGQKVWPGDGVSVTDSGFGSYALAPDGQNGVIVGWGTAAAEAYVQRVGATGEVLWGTRGIGLN
jgi:hypothetical protein